MKKRVGRVGREGSLAEEGKVHSAESLLVVFGRRNGVLLEGCFSWGYFFGRYPAAALLFERDMIPLNSLRYNLL